ncbi:replication associated protein [Human gemycircularvirus GeTz1]|uniref:Replication associated protein n=1 Tax=Human gemycircularvirus GeTz1 TaxID=1792832 RepID=A0A125R3J8_9VIRU|nr:replication associated protein [Human gemycircularvirus GeTz1]AMD08882.1 replication associated protein [Human gemycircularvirus GeTz1]
MSSFKFQSRYVLLTYPQCGDLDPWAVSDHLSSPRAECIVGREVHRDGGIHLHCFADFGKRFSSRNTKIFDVGGHHPNTSPSKGRPGVGYDYAIKDGDVVAEGLGRPGGDGDQEKLPTNAERWAEIVAAESAEEFLEYYWRRLDPSAMVRSFTQCRAIRRASLPSTFRKPTKFSDRSIIRNLQEWRDSVNGLKVILWGHTGGGKLSCPALATSLVLWGPSRLGGTLWARSLGNHAYFGGLFSMEEDITNVGYAVFDDIGGLKFLSTYKFWLSHQKEFYVTDRYKGKKLVQWGEPAIWVNNTDPREEHGIRDEEIEWLNANCQFVYIGESII